MIEFLRSFIDSLDAFSVTAIIAGVASVLISFFSLRRTRTITQNNDGSKNNNEKRSEAVYSPSVDTGAQDSPVLTIPEFVRLRRELKTKLEKELAEATDEERKQLHTRIIELQSQINNPEASLADTKIRIAELEALLAQMEGKVGSDRVGEAREALEGGDFSAADKIFAEVEARQEIVVEEAARAAFGRGEVAESEVRWVDANRFYSRAAFLDPNFRAVAKAREMSWLTGDYLGALRHAELMAEIARRNRDEMQLGEALNALTEVLLAQGKYCEAEYAIREALELGRATSGEQHPYYATRLNNLADVVRAQGRVDEAEGLYREALEITRATIDEGHPNYAIGLNNLALVAQAQGRYAEAEGLFREALEIGRATIGEGHPDYAARLNNLALAVQAQGRVDEAEGLFREALEIGRATLGEGHPEYAIRLGNLGRLLGETDRGEEGREMLERALAIFRDILPEEHPYIAETQRRLDALPAP